MTYTQQQLDFEHPETTAAIARAESGAGKWVDRAVDAIRRVAMRIPEFTTDDVWAELGDDTTPEPRAMGAAMRRAVREKIVAATGRVKRSHNPICHNRPLAVWRSRIKP